VDPSHVIGIGDSVELTCGASAYNFTNDLAWYHNDELIQSSEHVILTGSQTEYSHRKRLRLPSIDLEDIGFYECRVGDNRSNSIEINVFNPKPPIIVETNLDGGTMKEALGEPVFLLCDVQGIPVPEIEWFKVMFAGYFKLDSHPSIIFLFFRTMKS
jgi:hypothetical protein